ncbi:uncharacterized protein CPUR_05633 [Claviceps purpurea 20.1]|uniref:F-box domain-containing protein n=1 Tax=Claviceps purpurea (strain 20.1) TaxID=1111077 RepID=M1WCR6_CLAP2|nr:uncharacterized protein CPUR_05633 [Claviceps purpurea 20.1]
MDSAAHGALFMAREQNTEGSRCPMALLPPETKMQIRSHICTQESLSRLGQSCRAWYEVANEELYKRDSREYNSFAIKWMAFHAVDEQTTDSALRTLEISRRWGGQIDDTQGRDIPRTGVYAILYRQLYGESTALQFAVVVGNLRLTETLLDMKASLTTPCSPRLWNSKGSKELLRRFSYFQRVLDLHFCPFHVTCPIFLAFLQSDIDMCKLLVKHGAGREASIDDRDNDLKVFSILHFAAADTSTDYPAREARPTAREREADESRCLMALLPPETKIQIMSYISTQQSLSRLAQSCRAWYGPATQELYTRDAKEHGSFAIKWMAAHAVDEQTTDSALRTLGNSRRWGGQIDAIQWDFADLTGCTSFPWLSNDSLHGDMYEASTALHFAVVLRNMRLTETLLDMKASLRIPGLPLLCKPKGSKKLLRRFEHFGRIFQSKRLGPVFPIFLAFLQSDSDMCQLLIENGAGREAMLVLEFHGLKAISILHFAAADPTTDYRQWQCLFHAFREYIDEPCPRRDESTPLHIALRSNCIQGMQIAVETGADKEARDSKSRTPLMVGVVTQLHDGYADSTTFEHCTCCLRRFVELGGSVNPEGDSALGIAVQIYGENPLQRSLMRHGIDFLLEHGADINTPYINVPYDIIGGILIYYDDHRTVELFKTLLTDLVDRGLNLAIPDPRYISPLYQILSHPGVDRLKWLVDLLCEKGATIYDDEVDLVFVRWCRTSRLWETNKYNAWWQHQGQEKEAFQKWCEESYSAFWWQHIKKITPNAVTLAYEAAVVYEDRKLYDILSHLPLSDPWQWHILLVDLALEAKSLWSWRLLVLHDFDDMSLSYLSSDSRGENMIHLTIRKYVAESCYSAADAIMDVLHLRDKGADMTLRSGRGQTPLELLLRLDSCKDDFSEMVALFEGNVHKELASGPIEN